MRNEARADERCGLVAALRRKARAHERLSQLYGASERSKWHDTRLAHHHEGAANALKAMADRIERGGRVSTRDDYMAHDFINDGPARELLGRLKAAREETLAAARASGAAEERARIVAMLRSLARGIAHKDMRSESIGALRAVADRIERGET
jgi:hypothetical protein